MGAHGDQNQGEALIRGFHNETSESEVTQRFKRNDDGNRNDDYARIECPAKPITRAFIHVKNDDERNKYIRSANMLKKKELRGRKLKITRSMDAEERFHLKRMVYVTYCIHVKT